MNIYTTGSRPRFRFYATTRNLTAAEEATFFSGGGLPGGVGTTPDDVLFDYRTPDNALHTLEGDDVITDATGEFHVDLPVIAINLWSYRGYGQNDDGSPVFSSEPVFFRVIAF